MGVGSRGIAEYQECCSKLLYFYLELDDCPLVVVEIAVVGSREDGDDSWELFLPSPVVHLEPVGLSLMSPYH